MHRKGLNLYVHIPFCPKICPYCNFYKEQINKPLLEPFVEALLAELDAWNGRSGALMRPEAIFFGGGTPTALPTRLLEHLLIGLRARMDLSALKEWTFEMNPSTVSHEKARTLLELGVNRFSMGVQSWDDTLLATLGRTHSAEKARRSFEIMREAGCVNINLDLMFAVPDQTEERWAATLAKTFALAPEHISAYCLTYEEDTEFLDRLNAGEFFENTESATRFFEATLEAFETAGFHPYEISNFARPGRECLHNLGYWRGCDYLGLGPSAVSSIGLNRRRNVENTEGYVQAVASGNDPADFTETLTPEQAEGERCAFGLRTTEGIPEALLRKRMPDAERLTEEGLIDIKEGRAVLTRRGRLLADEIGALLV